jgi:hypothetical protein
VVVYPKAQLVRLAGERAAFSVTVRNITPQAVSGLRLTVEVDFGTALVEPPLLERLEPAQMRDFTLTLARPAGDRRQEGIARFRLTDATDTLLSHFSLPIDARQHVTPEDQGMIRVATATVRATPALVQYLAYLAAPLIVVVAWVLLRIRKRQASRDLADARAVDAEP